MNVLNFPDANASLSWSTRDLPSDLLSGFSIVFWGYINATGDGGNIFIEEIGGWGNSIALGLEGGSNWLILAEQPDGVKLQYGTDSYCNQWHQFAFVFKADNVYFYIDGVLQATGLGPLTRGLKKGSVLSLGKSYLGDMNGAKFKMSNFHIYTEELTVDKINKLYQYQAFYRANLETFFRLDGLTGKYINQESGAVYTYISSGVTVASETMLDIYNFRFDETPVPQVVISNALKDPQRVTMPKIPTKAEILLMTGLDLTGCSVLDLFIEDSNGNQVLAPIDPYLWYHFNESSGTNIADSSTHVRDAIFYPGTGGSFIAGKLGNSINYVGDTYVNAGKVANFEWSESFSLECWMYYTNDGYPRALMGHINRADPTDRGYLLFVNDGYPTLYISSDASLGKTISVYGNTQVPNAGWHHLVATYDGSGLAAGVKIYLDGVLQTMGVSADNLQSGTIMSDANFAFASANLIDWYFFGSIDEAVVYDFVLSQANVTFRYNGGDGTEQMIPQDYVTPISGELGFVLPSAVLQNPGVYKVQLKYGDDVFVNYSPIHTLEIVDVLG